MWAEGTKFAVSVDVGKFSIVTKIPGHVPNFKAILQPFAISVWIAVFAAILMFWTTFFSRTGFYDEMDVFILLRVSLGVIINEDMPNRLLQLRQKRKSFGLLILLFSWVPTALLIGLAYQSNLLAALVRRITERPADTFADILEQNLTLYV